MAKEIRGGMLAQICEALGVERVNEVRRVVVDIDSSVGYPLLYVERIGDVDKIVAALKEPGIEVQFQAPAATEPRRVVPPGAPVFGGGVSGANIAWGNGSVTQRS